MGGKKRRLVFHPHEKRHDPSLVDGRHCVYCGTELSRADGPFSGDSPSHPDDSWKHLYAKVNARSFAVCSEGCRVAAEEYVRRDRTWKIALYGILALCAVVIFIAALFEIRGLLLNGAIMLAGIGFTAFPYPISSFETFQSCPIKRVELICRVLGGVLIAAGLVFQLLG